MFTGIIKHTGKISKIIKKRKGFELYLDTKLKISNKSIGTSISINGVCLTLEKIQRKKLIFFISYKTFEITNFKKIKTNDIVNIEKSLKFGDEIAGHFVQGHVDTIGKITSIKKREKTWTMDIIVDKKFSTLLVNKGSIAINGVSLTIVKAIQNQFTLIIIPHTLKLTNIIALKIKDIVNIEFDIVIKYLSKLKK
jgi:riboflavin synthase